MAKMLKKCKGIKGKDFTTKKGFVSQAKKLAKKCNIPLKEAKYVVWYSKHNKI